MMLVWHRLNSAGTAYEVQGIIDDAYSVVWTERWQDYGEAEVVMAPDRGVALGDVLTMPGRDMAVEVTAVDRTEARLTVTGKDALSILDRRIVYPTVRNNGSVATFVQKMLANDRVVQAGSVRPRTLRPFRVGDLSAITATAQLQRSYGQIGETLMELGRAYGFDPVATLQGGLVHVGARVGAGVRRYWSLGGGLAGFHVSDDTEGYNNVMYIGGQEYRGSRHVALAPRQASTANLDRREGFLDRRDVQGWDLDRDGVKEQYGEPSVVSENINLTPVTEDGATVSDFTMKAIIGTPEGYNSIIGECLMSAVADPATLASACAQATPTGHYDAYETGTDVWTADIGSVTVTMAEGDMLDAFTYNGHGVDYDTKLRGIGMDELAQRDMVRLVEATVEGLTPYVDYSLGDDVTMVIGPTDTREGMVREIVESWDESGYRATPTFNEPLN